MYTYMLIIKMFFSLVGYGFFTYGRKQRALVPLLVGIGLFILPYFISKITTLLILGVLLAITPFVIRSPELWNHNIQVTQ